MVIILSQISSPDLNSRSLTVVLAGDSMKSVPVSVQTAISYISLSPGAFLGLDRKRMSPGRICSIMISPVTASGSGMISTPACACPSIVLAISMPLISAHTYTTPLTEAPSMDIPFSIYLLLRQIKDGKAKIINEYTRGVTYEGNDEAQIIMREEFDTYDAVWRGLGKIEKSGLRLNKGNTPVIPLPEKDTPTGCRCGDVICGRLSPKECPMFGKVCTPEDPVGPCMVSSEGACSASYKYDYT